MITPGEYTLLLTDEVGTTIRKNADTSFVPGFVFRI